MSRPSDPRRQLLVAALGLAVVAVNYGLHRVRPRLQRVQELEAQATKADEQRAGLTKTAQPRRTRNLERQVAALRATLRAREGRLRQARGRLTPGDQAGEVAVQVAALAREVGLRVEVEEAERQRPQAARPTRSGRRAGPSKPTPAPASTPRGDALGETLQAAPFQRSLRTWTVSGRFSGLRAFLERLESLPYQVLVVRLEVKRPDHLERYDPPLKIRMTVAL